MLALKRDIKTLKQSVQKRSFVHCRVDENFNASIITPGFVREYVPVPTLKKVHEEIEKYAVVCVMGPYGSGKSVGLNLQAVFNVMKLMPPCKDGIRRAKAAFIRNTYDELKQTTYEMFLSWFGEMGAVHATKKPLEIKINFNDDEGAIELFIQFLSLDKPEQYRKLRSSFFTFAYINEVSESPDGIVSQVLGRTGRFPSLDLLDTSKIKKWFERDILVDGKWEKTKIPYWSGVLCDTNPPEVDSDLYNLFEKKNPRGFKLYKQPAGLIKGAHGWEVNHAAENIERLGLNYYMQQTYVATEEYIRVFCCGEYGSIKSGKLIYLDYNDDIHAQENVQVLEGVDLRLSFDTWYTPACFISQYCEGQLRGLAALWEPDITVDAFIHEIVNPYIKANFPGLKVGRVNVDPAALAGEKVHGATSDYTALTRAYGSIVRTAHTNQIKPRHNAVTYLLKHISRGKPSLVIDKHKCEILRGGFLKHYVWRSNKVNGETIYEPKKNDASHIQDALQYDALDIVPQNDEIIVRSKSGVSLRPVQPMATGDRLYASYY